MLDKAMVSLIVLLFRFFLVWTIASVVLVFGTLGWIAWVHPRKKP